MKTASTLRSKTLPAACALLLLTALTSCELPPREAWNIIQRDGLITYWSREYNPAIAPSRYLPPSGGPLVTRPVAQVPYRPGTLQARVAENRYMASSSGSRSRSPYRPKPSVARQSSSSRPRPSTRPQSSNSGTDIVQKQESRILTEPSNTASAPRTRPVPSVSNPVPEAPKPSTSPMDSLPYGTPVAGRPGMVTSPFAEKQQLVDVTGMAAGEAVKDPYSGKLFRVPPTQQAAATKTESAPPPPASTPAPTPPADEAKPQP